MARKILFYETGPAEVLKIVEVPTPEPGAGEIRIRVKAIGLNRAEINFRAATYGPPPAFPDNSVWRLPVRLMESATA